MYVIRGELCNHVMGGEGSEDQKRASGDEWGGVTFGTDLEDKGLGLVGEEGGIQGSHVGRGGGGEDA